MRALGYSTPRRRVSLAYGGSLRQATDVQGAVTAAREWTPYGVEVGDPQPGLGFTGEWFDADVEAQYLRARWYDVATGRFTSRDPLNAEHPYAYVNNNPLNWIDPTGYFSEETIKNSIDLGGFLGSWGQLEVPVYRPQFSGLLMALKRAEPGDSLRSGRLKKNNVI